MARPHKKRKLTHKVMEMVYKPAGVPMDQLQQVILRSDELEALRLAHLKCYSQVEAASMMDISRSTFQRILTRAHRQVALALVEGKALILEDNQIESGPFHSHRSF